VGVLVQHRIEALVDIRRFPGSRKYPHWNQDNLAASLQEVGIEYHWIEALGCRRRSSKANAACPNLGLRNESFRNYADYMLTEEFHQGLFLLRGATIALCWWSASSFPRGGVHEPGMYGLALPESFASIMAHRNG
jgi:hypothetical protein